MKLSESLSIIIPVYNEEKRLPKTFDALRAFLAEDLFQDVEIIFVDDGSSDSTISMIQNCKMSSPIVLVTSERNRGKGHAVSQGMRAATKEYALMCDADISTPFSEIKNFISFINQKVDIIIGTRKAKGAHILKSQSFMRRSLGRCYTILTNTILGLSVSDFTCGFKIFGKKARQIIFSKTKIDRWSYDAEVLFIANKNNFSVHEVPVQWKNDENTRVRLRKDIYESFVDLWRIRFGNYD